MLNSRNKLFNARKNILADQVTVTDTDVLELK